jgi:hypothetical protein
MKIKGSGDSGLHSPECSAKPTVKKDRFSWTKRATIGSSFWDVENQLFERGLVAESWKPDCRQAGGFGNYRLSISS